MTKTLQRHNASEKNGGRKKAEDASPNVIEVFHQVLMEHTAGDPMREDVRWTNLSRRQIAKKMTELGASVSKNIVSRLLWNEGYRRRKSQKKRSSIALRYQHNTIG